MTKEESTITVTNDENGTFNDECLLAHNRFRAEHQSPPLEWSVALAELAQEWAAECAHKQHLVYREEVGIGENITFFPSTLTAGEVVAYWANERDAYDYDKPGWQAGTNYFTQLVWTSTRQLGVGRVKIEDKNEVVVVAFYRPAGNLNRKEEFQYNVQRPLSKVTDTSTKQSNVVVENGV